MTVAFDVEASALARRSTCPECGRHAIHGTGCSRGGVDVVTMLEGARVRVRARTISIKRLSKRELERGRMLYPETDMERPVTRRDCLHGPHAERPCPFVSCKHHLYLDVNNRTGSIKMNFPDLEAWELPETCALDIADRGGLTLEEVGAIMNLTRERVRQLETRGLAKLKLLGEMARMSEYLDEATTRDVPGVVRATNDATVTPSEERWASAVAWGGVR